MGHASAGRWGNSRVGRNGKVVEMQADLMLSAMAAAAPVITLAAIVGRAVVLGTIETLQEVIRIEKVGGMRFAHIKIGAGRKIVIMFCVSSKV